MYATQLSVIACAIMQILRAPHDALATLIPLTTVPLLIKMLGFFRGIDGVDWFVGVILQNMHDMRFFMVIVATFIVFFAVAFRVLYSSIEMDNEEVDDDTTIGLDSFSDALLTMFNMGLFGAFSVGGFEGTATMAITVVLFVMLMLFVTVIALNALIAILGDSFDYAQELKTANQMKQRAELMVEYYGVMGSRKRKEIEEKSRWIHRLVPASMLESQEDGEGWQGRMSAIRGVMRPVVMVQDEMRDEVSKLTTLIATEMKKLNEKIEYQFAGLQRNSDEKPAGVD